jgi:hypothetical protein
MLIMQFEWNVLQHLIFVSICTIDYIEKIESGNDFKICTQVIFQTLFNGTQIMEKNPVLSCQKTTTNSGVLWKPTICIIMWKSNAACF